MSGAGVVKPIPRSSSSDCWPGTARSSGQEQQLGLSLGTVLVYVSSFLAARTVALAWGQAAPLARSLSPLLPGGRRPVVATGPWAASTMVRLFGVPMVDSMLMTARLGTNLLAASSGKED
ncbi:MAG: hypothetical protein M3235_19680 [Actinomycetota bacterium]|nr:hypothetical protein [Actinomycetota bacterium]